MSHSEVAAWCLGCLLAAVSYKYARALFALAVQRRVSESLTGDVLKLSKQLDTLRSGYASLLVTTNRALDRQAKRMAVDDQTRALVRIAVESASENEARNAAVEACRRLVGNL